MPHLLAEASPCCLAATNATSCQTLGGQGAQKIVRETKNCQGVKRSKKNKKQRIDLSETGKKITLHLLPQPGPHVPGLELNNYKHCMMMIIVTTIIFIFIRENSFPAKLG